MLRNIKLNYLYRDAGNYKLFHFIVFRNDKDVLIEEVATKLRELSISGAYFVPEKWNLPRLNFENYVPEFDHQWHEVESVETTVEAATIDQDILEFIEKIVLE